MSETESIVPSPITEIPVGADYHPPAMKSTVETSPHKKFPILSVILLLVLSVVSVIAVYLFLQVRELSMSQPIPSPSPSPLTSPDPTSDWNTYIDPNNQFSFKYPSEFKISISSINGKKDPSRVDFNTDSGLYLSAFTQKIGSYNEANICDEGTTIFPCISKDTSRGSSSVSDIKLDGKKAKSIYFNMGTVDSDYHTVFTNESPYIELRMYISRGGLDKKFDQILSTFEFTDTSTSYTCPASGYVDCMPSPDGPKPSCIKEAMEWYKANCPDFQGGAL